MMGYSNESSAICNCRSGRMLRDMTNANTTVFKTDWWTVEVPAAWHAEVGERGVGFERNPPLGWLQVTAAHKPTAVTDADLEGFVADRISPEVPRRRISYGAFTGFSADHADEQSFWREWWLRCERMIVYATYNVPKQAQDATELAEAERLLSSIHRNEN